MGILDWILKQGSDQQTAASKQGKVGTLEWILRQGSDELAAESKQGKGGITNWLLRQELDELAARSSLDTDLRSIKGYWINNFRSYEDAIRHLDSLKSKYAKSSDWEMRDALDRAYRDARERFPVTFTMDGNCLKDEHWNSVAQLDGNNVKRDYNVVARVDGNYIVDYKSSNRVAQLDGNNIVDYKSGRGVATIDDVKKEIHGAKGRNY